MKNRKRNRLKGYDYSQDDLYFITICVKKMLCCLGNITPSVRTGRDLSPSSSSPSSSSPSSSSPSSSSPSSSSPSSSSSNHHLPSPTSSTQIQNQINELNEYGEIVKNRLLWLAEQYRYVVLHNYVVMPNHVHAIIEIDSSKVVDKPIKIKSLSSLVGAFKTTSSKMIHEAGFSSFAWHRSFHDHIIRSDKSYQIISDYIDQNPSKWQTDKFFPTS
ncbi:transposase [Aequorivita viscosa]|uniref:REP element-mobilizing transposase RayT n=1 Tax=Aequorivita viscosa TaxID=797419 RepID=A0A1M6M8L9_9FLAO|nr:transposase [Aequorivita viscosa]SDX28021.1 REP element-mobilizing transposase RayT [Aequorivita viscosa]SHJ79633.1 REP element-mobilizing transposase RayT [Aequorivita viscosa]